MSLFRNFVERVGGGNYGRVDVVVMTVFWLSASFACLSLADDWPMRGRDGTRNGVSSEVGAPMFWCVETRKDGRLLQESRGIRWSAPLGSDTYSSPIVSGGLVWIGTNSHRPGEDASELHSVLKCFRIADGKQVYEYDSPKLNDRTHDPGWLGLGSSPLIEGDRLWLATNRSEVLCLDIGPLLRGEEPPRELWKLDLMKQFDLFPYVPVMGPPRPCSIGPSWNGRLFVTTNNGIDLNNDKIPKPDAPNLVCLNKDTGEVFWTDNSPGSNILMAQFASPTVAEIRGQLQVIVPQSDGWVRAFDPMTGTKLWEFDVNLKATIHSVFGRSNRNSLLGSAVVYEDRVYLASGQAVEWGEGEGRLVCIDPTKRGDVSSELVVDAAGMPLPRKRLQAVDQKVGERAVANPNSALVWEFVRCGKAFEDNMHRMLDSVVVAKGLVFAADVAGMVHCFDARTGQRHWSHDAMQAIWASPLVVQDTVFVVDEDGTVAIFRLSADPEVAMRKVTGGYEPRRTIAMEDSIHSSPIFANGVLYLATRGRLFAIAAEKDQSDLDRTPGDRSDATKTRTLRSAFVPTPQDVVDKMLELAELKRSDVVYDLGSGDGRIVITAAKSYGCRAVGYELDKELVESSRTKADAAGVKPLVTFERQDLFTADVSQADVIAVFLLPQQLEKLLPQFEKLKPGVRIVSHYFPLADIPPDKTVKVQSAQDGNEHTVYLWTLPLKKSLGDSGRGGRRPRKTAKEASTRRTLPTAVTPIGVLSHSPGSRSAPWVRPCH